MDDQISILFRDLQESYRNAWEAWRDGDKEKSSSFLREATKRNTDLLFKLAGRKS